MRRIAVSNLKGGSGKTSLTVNLGACLAELGHTVCLIDLDPQASLTDWLRIDNTGQTVLDVLENNASIDSIAVPSAIPGVSVVPASQALGGLPDRVAGNPLAVYRLREALAAMPLETFDYVLVDCPPALGFLSVAALTGCREAIIPAEASALAVAGLREALKTIDRVRTELNTALTVTGIAILRIQRFTTIGSQVEEALRKHHGKLVFRSMIREATIMRALPAYHEPVTTFARAHPVAAEFRSLAKEVVRRKP